MRGLLLMLAAGAGACGAADAMPAPAKPAAAAVTAGPAQRELGLYPGETMAFEVKLAGILVGDAQLAVGDVGDMGGKRVVMVRSRAATAGAAALVKSISDEATSVIDTATGHPIETSTEVHMNEHKVTSHSVFAGAAAAVTYQRDEDAPKELHINFGTAELHDAHSAMAELRGWRAAPGTQRTVYVVGGRRLWRVDVTYVGEEAVGTELGNRNAVVFDGLSYRAKRDLTLESDKPARTFRVWLSNDGDRVPLRVSAKTELGDIEMTLTDYQRP